jgi:hypothetical protein
MEPLTIVVSFDVGEQVVPGRHSGLGSKAGARVQFSECRNSWTLLSNGSVRFDLDG